MTPTKTTKPAAQIPRGVRLGTISFTAHGLKEFFYPPKTKPTDYLGYYAERFNTVEIDGTFYRIPKSDVVRQWHDSVPDDFRFTAKIPEGISHRKRLVGTEEYIAAFYRAMEPLFPKTSALLLQMPKYAAKFDENAYVGRLRDFFRTVPKPAPPLALELRDSARLTKGLVDLLRDHNVSLVWVDVPDMPSPDEYLTHEPGLLPSTSSFVRLMGDRELTAERTEIFDKVVVDRHKELQNWSQTFDELLARKQQVHIFVSAYYEGNAVASIDRLKAEWGKRSVIGS
jgi:uncharacterized protein YecE (DUF72 family)